MENNYLNEWKRFLSNNSINEQTKMPAVLNAQEKAKIIAIALELYNAGKVQNLDPNLKTDLEAIKTKYPIDKRPDFAANVFDVYVEKNPLFLYIDKNNIK